MNRMLAPASALLAVTCSMSASADVVSAVYVNSSNYFVKLSHMPDFDQRRDNCCGSPGLPGDGGMYCVPTATMNLFAYAANHGFPFFDPGSGNWQTNALYDEANSAIAILGALMSTDASGGTGGTGWTFGSGIWVAGNGGGILTRTAVFLDGSTTPTVNGMAQKVATGGIVAFAYGRYNVIGTIDGVPFLDRTGGHAVTFVEAKRNGSTFYMRYRDPADSPADASQSTFINKEVTVTPINVIFDWAPFTVRTVHAISYPSDDGVIRLVDGYVYVKPVWFLSFINTGGQFQLVPHFPLDFGSPAQPSTAMGTIYGVNDLEIELDGASALALVQTSAIAAVPKLRRFDLAEHTFVDLAPNGLKRFTTGQDGRIYAHDGLKLYCFKPDGSLESSTSNIPVPTALAFDDMNKHVIVLSVPERKVTRLNSSLGHVGTFIIPTSMPMSGDGSVIVNPPNDHILFITDGSSQMGDVAGLTSFTFSQHSIPGLPMAKALSPCDDGKVFVSTPDGLRVIVNPTGGAWMMDTGSPFHDLNIFGRMASLRSRTNVNPSLHNGPDWNNIHPDDLLPIGIDVPDCFADIDGNNLVDGADLGRLLGAWGSADALSDFNGDGVVDGADLGLLLGEWGPCP